MSLLARHCVCSAVEFLRKSDSPRTKEGKRWRNIWRKKKKKKIRKWLTNPKVPVFCKDSDVEAAVLLWLNTLTLCVTAENGTVNQNIYITNGPIGGPFHMMFEPSCLHWFFLPCRCFFTVSQKKNKQPSTWKLNQTPSNWTTGRNDVTHTVTRVSFCSRCRVFWETRWSFCSALWVNYHLSKCPVLLTTLGVFCQQIKSTTELIRPTEETWRSRSSEFVLGGERVWTSVKTLRLKYCFYSKPLRHRKR